MPRYLIAVAAAGTAGPPPALATLSAPSRPSGGSEGRGWTLVDVDVAAIEHLARQEAQHLGRRPRTRLRYFSDLTAYKAASPEQTVKSPLRPSSYLRGECSRGRGAGERLIYVAPAASRAQLLETLTHEIAHGLSPWRESHSPG